MCGICGIVPLGSSFVAKLSRDRVAAMVAALSHRGPDDSDLSGGDVAVLGATRLAIRGLGSGKQPIVDAISGIVAVCNGEIDNHRELRRWLGERGRDVTQETDIAVIPELYLELGEAFVERLVGVFAIAIWDPRTECVVLARDRAGERPLFYSVADGVVRFATEIAALAGDGGSDLSISTQAMQEFLQTGCLISPTSPFLEIEKVAPGEIITIHAHGTAKRRFWRWNIGIAPKRAPDLCAFDEVFRAAVARQTDVDVPFGLFLSGGLDSSLVAAVARDLHPGLPLKAFSLRFRESSYDEGDFATAAADRLGLDSVSVWVEPQNFPETIHDLVRCVGEPLADPAWVPTALLARRAAQDVKLALAGEGGDEVFGGYPTYLAAQLGVKYNQLPQWMRALFRKAIEAYPESDRKVTVPFLLKRFVQGTQSSMIARHLFWKMHISPSVMARLGMDRSQMGLEENNSDTLDMLQRIDLETTLAEGLLTKADRASMASALELRTPFLDQYVMEFAATLPVDQRVRGFTTKYFLKNYALRYLPSQIVHRRKRGLSVPLAQWLRGPLFDWAQDRLASNLLPEVGIVPAAPVGLLEEHCLRRADHARILWALLVMAEWLDWRKTL